MESLLTDEIAAAFPMFLEPGLLAAIEEHGRLTTLEPGDELMQPGRYIKSLPLVLDGRVRISREDGEGQELLLYFLTAGQTCATSLSCCMADQKSAVHAVVEEETRLLAIPIDFLDDWMLTYPSWKNFVMRTYGSRFEELLRAFDAVAFLRMDERLLQYLAERRRVEGSDTLHTSHQEIASALNTSREVVSRLLKKLEHQGSVRLGRNKIEWVEEQA